MFFSEAKGQQPKQPPISMAEIYALVGGGRGANAQDPFKNYCNNESTVSYNMLTVLLVCRFNGGWGLGSVPVVLFLVDCLPEVLLL